MELNAAGLAALKAQTTTESLKQYLEAKAARPGHPETYSQLHVTLIPVLVCRHTSRVVGVPSDKFIRGFGRQVGDVRTHIEAYALKDDGTIDEASLHGEIEHAIEAAMTADCDHCGEQFFTEELTTESGERLCAQCRKELDGECGPNDH